MNNAIRLLCSTVIALTVFPIAAWADDDPDWRTIEVPAEIYVCNSPELLKTLNLSTEQRTKLNSILDQWKSKFLAARKEYNSQAKESRRGAYGQHRDRDLQNTISDLLDDRQHQLFHQMLTLWAQSPVQSWNAVKFELGLSGEQHRQLHELETVWILHALKHAPDAYQHQRHTERTDRGSTGLRAYRYAITRLAWQFVPQRNDVWNKILTPEQARQWKEKELEWAFQVSQFGLLFADFSVYRTDSGQLSTGTWLDHTVPYFTPPFEALELTEEQISEVRKLLPTVTLKYEDSPKDRQERIRWLEAHHTRSIECMKQIEQTMTVKQRETWWQLFGEPSPQWNRQLLEMRANSLLNRPENRAGKLREKDRP